MNCSEACPKSTRASRNSGCVFDLANDEREVEDLEHRSGTEGYWDDPDSAQREMRRLGELKARLNLWNEIRATIDDLREMVQMAAGDEALIEEIATEHDIVLQRVDQLELQLALSEPYDDSNAILIVHSGEGGVDAQDFAQMLSRMYLRWADRHGMKGELLNTTDGDEAGIKNATIEFRGPHAYGLLKGEGGPHRLVRLSPFDSANRRHTAFALVEVIPEIETDSEVDLRMDDVRVDTFRSSGAGGQHVNKTDSAVRLTHEPSGIVVSCQNERSQQQNREAAFKILRARLLERKLAEQAKERTRMKGSLTAAGFGSRIRSYVLHPYTQVTDHRTGVSIGDANAVLDGEIDPLIDGYMKMLINPSDDQAEPSASA
jgi:peptide chain release factor 2